MLYTPGAYWSLYSTNFDFLFSLATISRETLSIPFQDLHITKQCPCNVVELWGKPRVEMSGCCKRCHPMQRVSNFGHLFSPIRNNWVKRNVDLLGMFFCCFFFLFPRIPPATRAYFEIWLFCMYCDWQDYYFAKNCVQIKCAQYRRKLVPDISQIQSLGTSHQTEWI